MTLIELVTSLAISGVLVLAMGSSILIASQALPRAGGEAQSLNAAARGWAVIAEDLRLAETVKVVDSNWLEIEIPPDGGSAARSIRIGIVDGQPNEIVRQSGTGPVAQLIGSVTGLSFTEIDGSVSGGSDRIRAEFRVAGHAFLGEQRLLNTARID